MDHSYFVNKRTYVITRVPILRWVNEREAIRRGQDGRIEPLQAAVRAYFYERPQGSASNRHVPVINGSKFDRLPEFLYDTIGLL